ncbi:type IV pilus modification protein PilV [Acinetobacter johnsonii]|uniref:type IV pilus modification protein PilV n=1 Tax=Acinetobacter johnsonii TaxID=40214 RepID=UPI0030F5DF0C
MKYQKGVGLMEVIISVLVLGLAVLGFIALQYRSLELASEALKKVEAVNLASNLAERMYVNRTSYTDADGLIAGRNLSDCVSENDSIKYCNAASFAAKDIADIQAIAAEKNMQINVFTCPDTSNNRNCIYVAWDETQAIQGDEGDAACTSEDDFSYLPNAKCVVVETF